MRLAAERLLQEGGHHAAVAQAHARAVGVEDPHDAHLHAVVPVVGHGHRLGEALGLVVDAARPDRVDVAPVALGLRVDQRIAVDLRGRGEQEARPLGLGEPERVVGAERADLERLDRQLEVVDRATPARRSGARSRPGPRPRTASRRRARRTRSRRGRAGARCCRVRPVIRLSTQTTRGPRRAGARRGASRGSRRRR